MRIHFIQHEDFENPGAYLDWAVACNHQVSFSKVHLFEALPTNADGFDMLIVLGGPQSPDEDRVNFPYYDPQAEQRLIQQAIHANKVVVGICLGAQLIGASFGVSYSHSPHKEIGNFPILLNEEGLKDDNIAHFGHALTVGHWHNDMPNLTNDAVILATSQGCPRQIVRYSPLVYGFQCHLEFTQAIAKDIVSHENLAKLSTEYPFVQKAEDILTFDYQAMNNALWGFLDKLTTRNA